MRSSGAIDVLDTMPATPPARKDLLSVSRSIVGEEPLLLPLVILERRWRSTKDGTDWLTGGRRRKTDDDDGCFRQGIRSGSTDVLRGE